MRRADRIKRDIKLLKFLTTPIKYDQQFLHSSKNKLLYPTAREASKIFDLSAEYISKKIHDNLELYGQLKAEHDPN